MQDTTPDKAANLAERREQVRSLLGRLISERASERAEEREDDLAALRGEAAEAGGKIPRSR